METLCFATLFGGSTFSLVMTVVCCGLAGYVAYQIDEKVEDKKRHALEIEAWAIDNGLDWVAKLMQSYAVGDKSGMVRQLAEFYSIFRDDNLRAAAFRKLLDRQLALALADPERREVVYKAVNERKIIDGAEADAVLAKAEAMKKAAV